MRCSGNYLSIFLIFWNVVTSDDQDSGIAGPGAKPRSSTTSSFVFSLQFSLVALLSISSSTMSLLKVFKLSNVFSMSIVSFYFPFNNTLCQDCRISWSSLPPPFSNVSVPSTLSYSFPDPPPPPPLSSTGLAEDQRSPIQGPEEEEGGVQRKPQSHQSVR